MAKQASKKLVLLDMHAILHRSYHALPDFSSPTGEPTGALYGLAVMILKLANELNPDYVIGCYDLAGPTFRTEAYAEYKAGRLKTEEALIQQINTSRELLDAFSIPHYEKEGFEADDLLGTISEMLKDDSEFSIVIASGDMDTLQLVEGKRVQVYTLRKGIKDTVMYDEKAVVERFGFDPSFLPDFKGLRGDPSDNIPGVSGIGEKTATILIKEFGRLEDIYSALEKDENKLTSIAGISPRIVSLLKDQRDEAFFSRELATIRKDANISFSIPDIPWKSAVDEARFFKAMDHFGFKSLKDRAGGIFGFQPIQQPLVPDNEEDIDDRKLKEARILLWLLDSERGNANVEDILSFTNKETFEEAYTELQNRVKKEGRLFDVYTEIEEPLIDVIEKMEERGVKLDVNYLDTYSQTLHGELSRIEKRIYELTGEEFNINSPKQLGEVLFDKLGLSAGKVGKTSTGQRSTRESQLEKIMDDHPVIPMILEYREVQKLLSTYIDVLPRLVDENNRLHTQFLQDGTTTGRMASQNPNLQNIPIKTDLGRNIRNAFIAEEGFVLVSLDYSQIELRIAAVLSGDEKLISVFRENRDIHASVASAIFNVDENEVTKAQRSAAKVINFGILYGMGVNALRRNLGNVSQKEAQAYLDEYFKTFSRLKEWIEETKGSARKNGFTETIFGRKRYFPDITSRLPYVRSAAERTAVNAPIQGTQADVIKRAMVDIDRWVTSEKKEDEIRMLLQIHDELVFEIKAGAEDDAIPHIKEIMEGVVPRERTRDLVFRVEAQVGANWGEMEKRSIGGESRM